MSAPMLKLPRLTPIQAEAANRLVRRYLPEVREYAGQISTPYADKKTLAEIGTRRLRRMAAIYVLSNHSSRFKDLALPAAMEAMTEYKKELAKAEKTQNGNQPAKRLSRQEAIELLVGAVRTLELDYSKPVRPVLGKRLGVAETTVKKWLQWAESAERIKVHFVRNRIRGIEILDQQ